MIRHILQDGSEVSTVKGYKVTGDTARAVQTIITQARRDYAKKDSRGTNSGGFDALYTPERG